MNSFIDKILLGIFMLFYKQILIERRFKGFQIRDYRISVLKAFIVEGLQLYFHAIPLFITFHIPTCIVNHLLIENDCHLFFFFQKINKMPNFSKLRSSSSSSLGNHYFLYRNFNKGESSFSMSSIDNIIEFKKYIFSPNFSNPRFQPHAEKFAFMFQR